MNRDTKTDILRVLKSKKYYAKYSSLRIIDPYINYGSKKLATPTIFEFKFDNEFNLILNKFLRNGRATIFWNGLGNSVEIYSKKSSPSYKYEKGIYKVLIFADDKCAKFSSRDFCYPDISNHLKSFINIGDGFCDLSNFFRGSKLGYIRLNHLDVSNVVYMDSMFLFSSEFDSSVENWDVSNVFDMSNIFENAGSFNQDIRDWNVSNVQYMSYMFTNSKYFNQPIGDWNVSNVRYMDGMFQHASSFNQSIENWNVSNVKYMDEMFRYASSFDQNIENWDFSNVLDITDIFGKNNLNKRLIEKIILTRD